MTRESEAWLESFLQNQEDVVHVATIPGRAAAFQDTPKRLHKDIHKRLEELGIEKLYAHQTEAIELALDGKNVMVSTGTNSGKSLCYFLPTLHACLSEPNCRALFMYPTKALAQDQFGKISEWIPSPSITAATYDGDTPQRQRGTIRKLANIILTNPDMLHVGILPGHENWIKFFKSLRYVVLDEAHMYRGIFGSHVAWIVRRLLRLCEFYGSRPQVIACSATVGNPEEHFESLIGRPGAYVAVDGSPKGKRTFAFVNPQPGDDGKPVSRNMWVAKSTLEFAEHDIRSMVFCRSRVGVELVLRYLRDLADSSVSLDPGRFESYRAGYTPEERRAVERALFQGEILGLATTNAMELGVDIGGLDAVLMNGYPGTISSFWQQAGRAGRGQSNGAAFLVAQEDPLDQFLISSPTSLLASEAESMYLNFNNRNIAAGQLECMAHEKPILPNELLALGPEALDIAEKLDGSGQLEFRAGRFFYPSYQAPALHVNIRGSGTETIELNVDGEALGSMERWRALQNAHVGAIYLHRGSSYLVEELDLETRMASLRPFEANYYTESMVQSVIEPLLTLKSAEQGLLEVSLCGLRITSEVAGYRQKALDGGTVMAVHELDLPATTIETLGVRVDLPAMEEDEDPERHLAALHGFEHAILAVAPFVAGCDRGDLGSGWYGMMHDTMRPAVFVYDGCPGGVGLSERMFEHVEGWLWAARRLLEACPCPSGCPRCLLSARCEVNNDLLSKEATMSLMRTTYQADE